MRDYRFISIKRRRRSERRFKRHVVEVEDKTCQELLGGIWHLDWKSTADYRGVPPDPYLNHWMDCFQIANDRDLMLDNRKVASMLVDCLRNGLDVEIGDLRESVRQHLSNMPEIQVQVSDNQAKVALEFAVSLWMHASIDLTNWSVGSLRDIVQECLPQRSNPNDVVGELGHDFCKRSLWRKGGIRTEWTNDLCQHLRCHEDTVRIFRNSSMLRSLQNLAEHDPQKVPFTAEFLSETLQTLYLFFRPMDTRAARRNVRYMEKHLDADLELAMGQCAEFELNQYPHWHRRLKVIQETYNRKTPSGIVQWWFDRRDRVQWATFWVAFMVFIMTIVFGIISSVTGVLQAYAIYHITT